MRYLSTSPIVEAELIGQFHQEPEFLVELSCVFNDACLWDNERHSFKSLDTNFYVRPTKDDKFVLAIESGPDNYIECVEYDLEEVHAFLLGGSLEYVGMI